MTFTIYLLEKGATAAHYSRNISNGKQTCFKYADLIDGAFHALSQSIMLHVIKLVVDVIIGTNAAHRS